MDIKVLLSSPLPWYKILFILFGRTTIKIIYITSDLIDSLFFARYKDTPLSNPVFLLGHPRSGTTFLHRFLVKNLPNYRGMLLWDMFAPSIFLRRLLKPFIPVLDRLIVGKIYDPKIHHTGLLKEETDDAALFFKSFEGLFSWLYFGAFKQYDDIGLLKRDLIKTSNLNKTLKNLNALHKKNLYRQKNFEKEIFSKSFSFVLDIEAIIERFPNAKIMLLVRDPLDVIPSSMSLAKSVLTKLYDFDSFSTETKKNYYDNLYSASIFFYKALHETLAGNAQISDNLHVISYVKVKNDFSLMIQDLLGFLKIEPKESFIRKINEQKIKQVTYKSKHIYDLEEFYLSETKIKKDFRFIYDNYEV